MASPPLAELEARAAMTTLSRDGGGVDDELPAKLQRLRPERVEHAVRGSRARSHRVRTLLAIARHFVKRL